jgi:sporulation protein YlmC with PRC-barrel domain
MKSVCKPVAQESASTEWAQKLMVHGFVCPESNCALSAEVSRGMSILSKEGGDVGHVAAVILDSNTQKATHILLCRLPQMRGYWMIPVGSISQVQDGIVRLAIPGKVVDTLPLWRSVD